MRHTILPRLCIVIALCLLAAACSRGGQAGRDAQPTSPAETRAQVAALPIPTQTPTPFPTYTLAPTRRTFGKDLPTATPTPALPVTAGQAFPFPLAAAGRDTVGQLVALGEYGEPAVWEVHLSADGSRLAIVTPARIDIYDAITRRLVSRIEIQVLHGHGHAVTMSADGTRLVALTGEQVLVLSSQGDPLQILPARPSYLYRGTRRLAPAGFSPDGRQVAVLQCSDEQPQCQVEVRDTGDNRLLYSVTAQPDGNPPLFSQDGSLFGYQAEGSLWIVHSADWKFIRRIWLGENASWAFSPEGSMLAVIRVNRVEIFETTRDKLLVTLRDFVHSGQYLPQVAFSEHSRAILALDAEGMLNVWSLPKGKRISQQQSRYASLSLYQVMDSGEVIAVSMPSRPQGIVSGAADSFAFSTQGDALLYSQQGNYSLAENRQYCQVPLGGNPTCMPLNGSILTDALGNLYRWEDAADGHVLTNASGDPLLAMPGNGREIVPLWVSTPGGALAYRYTDSSRPKVQQFAIKPFSGIPELQFDRQPENVAVSAGGSTLALVIQKQYGWRSSRDVLVLDLRDGQVWYQQEGLDPVDAIGLSPASRWLAITGLSGEDGSIHLRLVDLSGGNESDIALAAPSRTAGRVASLQYSWDESLLAVGFSDGSLALLDVGSGGVLRAWQPHRDAITALAFSPDGRMLATYSLDGLIQVWGIRPW